MIEKKGQEFALGGEAEREAESGDELSENSQFMVTWIYRFFKTNYRKRYWISSPMEAWPPC